MKIVSIGRSDNCDIVLSNAMTSRRHAMLRIYVTGRMEIIDMSQNGTFVNNIRIKPNTPFPVTRKDVVFFAETEQLDWTRVPNPMRRYVIVAAAVAAVAILAAILALVLTPSGIDYGEPSPKASVTGSTERQPSSSSEEEVQAEDESNSKEGFEKFFRKKKKKKEVEEPQPEETPSEENQESEQKNEIIIM